MIKLIEICEEGETLFMLNGCFDKLNCCILHNDYFPPFYFINNCTDNRKSVF